MNVICCCIILDHTPLNCFRILMSSFFFQESVEHANTLLKQHDETEAKVSQQDKNLKALCLVAEDSSMKGHQDYLRY